MRSWRAQALIALLPLVSICNAAERSLTREQRLGKLQLEERVLQLEQRRSSLETQRHELETIRDLFKQGYVALQTYQQTENSYQDALLKYEEAEILLEQTKLDLLKNATRIVVREARKYKTDDGRGMVDIVLENASEIGDALLVDTSLTVEELRTLLKVENIYVSIRKRAIVGEPYETHIPALEVGQQRSLTFRLLRDEDAVVVVLNYLDIEEDTRFVILKKGSAQELPSVNSAQFSQTGALDAAVRFDLTLERLAEEERSFALAVVGLPPGIDYAFVDEGAKINQVKFDETVSKDTLALELRIPENLDRRFVGRTRTIFAMVAEPTEYGPINALRARYGDDPVPEEEVKALQVNYVRLELIPKGVGELEVLVSNRYQEIEVGEELKMLVQFLNRGTESVQNIKAVIDLPYEWESAVEPGLIKILDPDDRVDVKITARPPADISAGSYDVGVEAQGQVGNINVESPEKNITVRVAPRSRLGGTVVLIGILVVLVVGTGLASIRISRR